MERNLSIMKFVVKPKVSNFCPFFFRLPLPYISYAKSLPKKKVKKY